MKFLVSWTLEYKFRLFRIEAMAALSEMVLFAWLPQMRKNKRKNTAVECEKAGRREYFMLVRSMISCCSGQIDLIDKKREYH